MTDEDAGRAPFDDEVEMDEAAEAFAALRRTLETQGSHVSAEMTVIRKGVEAAFEQFEKYQQPVDHSEDLATMGQALAHVVERIQAIEKSPILKNGPEYYARILERSAESAMRIPVTQFENSSRDLHRIARQMEDQLEAVRDRRQQNRILAFASIAAFVLGVLAVFMVPRLFPNSLAPRVASLVMAGSPWQAGMELLTWASPESVSRVASADQLVQANKDELTSCREAAKKSGKDQRCTITVATPRP